MGAVESREMATVPSSRSAIQRRLLYRRSASLNCATDLHNHNNNSRIMRNHRHNKSSFDDVKEDVDYEEQHDLTSSLHPSTEPPMTIHAMDQKSRQRIADQLRKNASIAPPPPAKSRTGLAYHRPVSKRSSASSLLVMTKNNSAKPSTSSGGLTAPPVFPKNLSLFDEKFHGGVYSNPKDDRELMSAVAEARRRYNSGSAIGVTTDELNTEDGHKDSADNNTNDSGRSSLTDISSQAFHTAPNSRRVSLADTHTVIGEPKAVGEAKPPMPPTTKPSPTDRQRSRSVGVPMLKYQRSTDSAHSEGSSSIDEEEVFTEDSSDNKHSNAEDVETPRANAQTSAAQRIRKRFRKVSTDSKSKKVNGRKSSWTRGIQRLRALSVGSLQRKEGEKPSSQPFGSGSDLNREWEIVTVREMCRRLSLEDSFEPSEMPLPEGANQSQILDEYMVRQILDILPPRAEGYPWVNIYNSEKHGFSLSTLYRKMSEWTEEMSPILLVVRDVNGHVFGAIGSTALRPSEHYYGTGDSCLLFRFTGEFPHTRELRTYTWTGDNQFFINASKDFLSMGAGGGHYGLWLDADLNHGRSQKCATFDNEPLAGGEKEDFVVQFVEAFGFSMA